MIKNGLTIDQAITQTIAAATEQGLPKDVALTALLIDTHGHATVAAQLDAYINNTPNAWNAKTALVTDATTALEKDTLAPAQIVETIRESIDALAHYAPAKIFGSADMHFAEVISTLNTAASADHADLRTYLKQNHDLDLAVGEVFAAAKFDFASPSAQPPNAIFSDLRSRAAANGLPIDIAYCAMLAHFPPQTSVVGEGVNTNWNNLQQHLATTTAPAAATPAINPAAATYVEALAQHLGTSSWGTATSFAKDMQQSMWETKQGFASGHNFTVDKAHALIEMAVDTLARYAPTKVEGTPQLHAAELLFQLTMGGTQNIGAALKTELTAKYEYEMRLGEIVNAAQWGVTNLDVTRAQADTQGWTDRDSIPRVYGLIAAIADHTAANATILAQRLSDGISNGSLEQDIVGLVKAGKITAEQALTSMTESLDVLARYNKIPLNMPPDVARAYVFDKIVDLATAQGVTGLVNHLKANFADDLKAGDQVQAYLTGHAGTVGAAAEWAGFVANSHMNLAISNGLATGDVTIQSLMTTERLTAQQAEQLLFTCASNGKVALPIVIAELEALRNTGGIPVADMIAHLGAAIKANTLNDDVAVVLIAGLAGYSVPAAQNAHNILDALVASGDLKPQQILEDTANAFKSHTLSDVQGMTALAMLAGSASVELRNGAVNVIGTLIQAGHADAATAIAALHGTAASLLTPAQAVTTLLSVAQFSGLAGQIAVAAEFTKMTGVDVVAAIHNGVMTHLLAGDAALHVLAELASAKPALQAAVITETANLVRVGQVTADAALGVLAAIAGTAPAMQAAVNTEVVAMVRAGQFTADHVIAALTTMAAGNLAMQTSVCAEITALVTAGLSTAAHAVEVMARLGAGATDVTQRVIGEEIAALVAAGKITGQAAAQTLCSLAVTGAPALRAFVGEELASLASHKLITDLAAVNVLRAAFPGAQPAPAFWTAFTAMAGEGSATLLTACAKFAAPFLQNNGVASVMSSIDTAVTSGAVTAHQALTTLGCLANTLNIDSRTYNPIGAQISNEFAAIVHRTGISAADAMLDVIHATGKPSLMLMTSLAHNENELLAGIGGALAKYATEAKQTPTQIFNMLTAQAPSMSGYGTILVTRPEQLLAISLGLAAEATGDLQKTARDVVERSLTQGQSGLPNYGSPFGNNGGAEGVSNALAIVVDAGMHGDAKIRATVMDALGQLVQNGYYNYGQQVSGVEILRSVCTAAGKTADGLKFVSEAITQIISHGTNVQPILDFITGSSGGNSWGGSGSRNFPVADALNLLVQAANGASSATRDLIAAEILSSGDLLASLSLKVADRPAALQAFLSNHLSDGLAEAILAKQVATGALGAGNAIATLNGIVDAFMKSHPTADRAALVAVSMAHLNIAVHAATFTAQNAIAVTQSEFGNWGNNARNTIPAGLTELQKIINTTGNLQQVLTGLGMLQISQSTAVGMSDVLNMAHQSIVDYTTTAQGTSKSEEQAKGSANAASAFFSNGFELMAANWKTAGILKNEIIAHPENYKSWVNLGANMMSAEMASNFISGGQATGGGYYFKMVTAGSTLLAAAFESDAVVQALGKDQALALSAPCRILSLGCNALCNMFSGMIAIGGNSAVGASVGLFETFSDISHGRNANESAQKFGNNLLLLVSGAQANDARSAGGNFVNYWSAVGDGHSGNMNKYGDALGADLQHMLYDNNVYMQKAKDELAASARSITNVGQQLGSALSNIGGAIGDTFVTFGKIVNFSSY